MELVATPDKAAFREAVVDSQIAMITPYATLTADDFALMKRCRGVVRYGMGYDNIDVSAATQAGIPVSIVPGASNEEVASHAVAMGLALARRLIHGHNAITEGSWNGDIAYDTPKISDLEVHVLRAPEGGRPHWVSHFIAPRASELLVRVRSSEGIEGFGLATSYASMAQT